MQNRKNTGSIVGMRNILSVGNMRESDAATIASGIPGTELMRRAGQAIFDVVEAEHGWQGKAGILCGSGNNAGDGYVLALLLSRAGYECEICLTGHRFSSDGEYYYKQCLENNISSVDIIQNGAVDINILNGYTIIVDCLYGTGFHGDAIAADAELIDAVNMLKEVYIISVDINSGLNGNNGMATKCIHSDLTVSVGDYQPGHFLNMAKDVMKKHINCPIGIEPKYEPYYLFEADDVADMFPTRKNISNKGTYGYIALIGGSSKYSGAVRLANMATCAMRCGAGVVSVAAPVSLHNVISTHMLESTFYPLDDNNGELLYNEKQIEELIAHRRAIAFGMGIGRNENTAQMLRKILLSYAGVLIIDADGISDLADIGSDILHQTEAKVILTPHLGEMSRLTGLSIDEIKQSPVEVAVKYAKEYRVTVLLKGPSTIVTDGEKVYITDRGCAGMATAGSGDVLSGIIAAVAGAHGDDTAKIAITGAWINGAAGEAAMEKYGDVSMIASDTANQIPEILRKIRNI